MNIFQEVNKIYATRHQTLGLMWVFTYKIDSQEYLTKCRAQLVICRNQQAV